MMVCAIIIKKDTFVILMVLKAKVMLSDSNFISCFFVIPKPSQIIIPQYFPFTLDHSHLDYC